MHVFVYRINIIVSGCISHFLTQSFLLQQELLLFL